MTVLAFIIGITATFLYIAVPLINKEINNLVENLPKILNDFDLIDMPYTVDVLFVINIAKEELSIQLSRETHLDNSISDG